MLYTVLDLESTGYHKEGGDEILSLGYMRINSSFEIKASGTLYFYKPNFPIERNQQALAVHKLHREFMKQYEKDFYDNIKKLYALCYKSTIIGKNSTNFDMPFIKNFIKRHCPTLPDLEYLNTFDVQAEFSKIFQSRTGRTNKGTLTDYIECLGITPEDMNKVYDSLPSKDNANMHMHGALYDCVATYLVFIETCKVLNLKP